MSTMMCKRCNMANTHAPSAKFCWQCGDKLIERSECECGFLLHPADRYCPGCGKDLREVARV